MKKSFACMLSILLVIALLGFVSTIAYAQNESEFTYTLQDGVLTVYGTGEMPSGWSPLSGVHFTKAVISEGITSLNNNLFYNQDLLESVTLPSTLVRIERSAFYDCDNLKEIRIPEGVTTIESGVFSGCDMLRSVSLPGSLQIIESNAFSQCKSLPEIQIPAGVTELQSYAFSGCTALRSVTLPESLKKIGEYAFTNCTGLLRIAFADGLEAIENGAFDSCTALAELELPDTLSHIGYSAFNNCDALKEIRLPDSVVSMGTNVFYGCDGLTTVTLGGGLAVLPDSTFVSCDALKTVQFSSGTTHINRSAFQDCSKLTEVFLPETLQVIGSYAFQNCSRLKTITIPDGTKELGQGVFYQCDQLTTIVLPEGLQTIQADAFYNCTSLSTIKIPDSVRRLENHTFYNCTALTSVELPQTMDHFSDYVFYNCSRLKSITIPEGVTEILRYTFSKCSSLEQVTFPSTLLAIRENAFASCARLTQVTLPNGLTTLESKVFQQCSSLRTIRLPDSLLTIGDSAFQDCDSLQQVKLPSELTALGQYAFYDCDGLARAELPGSLTQLKRQTFYSCDILQNVLFCEGLASIGSEAFSHCKSLGTIELPDSLESIGSSAFYSCSALREIRIPEGVTTLGKQAFYSCTALKQVQLPSTLEVIEESAFSQCAALSQLVLKDGLLTIEPYAFSDCIALISAELPSTLTKLCGYAFYQSGLKSIQIPEGITEVHAYTFYNCSGLTAVELPQSLITIGSYAFHRTGLTQVNIPAYVEVIGDHAFSECANLTSANLSAELKSLGQGSFANTALTEIRIPDGITSISERAFYRCLSLGAVQLPENLDSIGNDAFYECASLGEIILPSTLTSIGSNAFYKTGLVSVTLPEGLYTLGQAAFNHCSSLVSVELPSTLTVIPIHAFSYTALTSVVIPEGVYTIEDYAFRECGNLRSVTFPNSLSAIGSGAFRQTALESVVLPEHLVTVNSATFSECSKLSHVTLPEGLVSIDYYAFGSCSALKELLVHSGVVQIDSEAFYNHPESFTLYVFPDSYAMNYAREQNINYEILTSVVNKLTLTVQDEQGSALTDGLEIRWYRNNEYIGSGSTIRCGGSTAGYGYQVVLNEALSYCYHIPGYCPVPADSDGELTLILTPLRQLTLTAIMEDPAGVRLPATVTMIQKFGAYETTSSISVDHSGIMTAEAYNVPTELVIDCGNGYYTYRTSPDITHTDLGGLDLGKLILYPVPEANRIHLTVALQKAAEAYAEYEILPVSNLDHLQFTLFNETTGLAMTAPRLQNNTLYLTEGEASAGDTLLLTIGGLTDATANRVRITMNSDLTAEATIHLLENGGFDLPSLTGCDQVLVMLFDEDGNWRSGKTVAGSYASEPLAQGTYQAVLMQDNSVIRCVQNLKQLNDLGLTEMQDYLLLSISVENGLRISAEELQIPVLDQSKFNHTIPALTNLNLTKSRFPLGQYISVRLSFALEKPFAGQVSEQTISLQLPEGLSLVEGSVYEGNDFLNYTLSDGTLTIPVGKSQGVIGFYLYGNEPGEYPLNAFLLCNWNGQAMTQSLASVPVTVENAALRMAEVTSQDSVSVTGSALKNSTVHVYDNGMFVGTAQTNNAGSWSLSWELTNYSNYYAHNVHTVIENELFTDPVVTSGQTLIYDAEYPEVSTVTVLCDQASEITFNFADPSAGSSYYSIYSDGPCTITYVVRFGDKAMNAQNVQLNVFLPDGRALGYPTQYSETLNAWVLVLDTTTSELPENVGVEFDYERPTDVFSGLGSSEAGMAMLEEFEDVYHDYLDTQFSYSEPVLTDDGLRLDMSIDSLPDQQVSYYFTMGDYSDYAGLDLAEAGFARSEEDPEFFVQLSLTESAIQYVCVHTGDQTVVLITVPMSLEEAVPQSRVMQTYGRNTTDSTSIFMASSAGRKVVTILENLPAPILPPFVSTAVGGADNIHLLSLLSREHKAYQNLYAQTREMLNERCTDGTEKYAPSVSLKYLDELLYHLEKQSQFRQECQDAAKKQGDNCWRSLGLDIVTLGAGKWLSTGAKIVKGGGTVFKNVSSTVPAAAKKLMNATDKTVMLLGTHELRRQLSLGAVNFAAGWSDLPEGSLGNPIMGAINAADNVLEKFDPTGQGVHYLITNGYHNLREELYEMQRRIRAEQTICNPEDEPEEAPQDDKSRNPEPTPVDPATTPRSPSPNAAKIVDPAGFLYEAVPSNRLQGVTVRAYHQDADGKAALWNAQDYDQMNPLITDQQGCYAWFVPFGMWQVEARLEGYETAYSPWLPVPPPQMEVHIGMISTEAPEVETVMVTPNQVIVVFSQYMDINSVCRSILLQTNGSSIAFETIAVDREFDLKGEQEFATRFLLKPEQPLTGTVLVKVSDQAENYAGTALTGAYQSQEQLPVVLPEQINMREEYVFVAGSSAELNLSLIPGLEDQSLNVVSSMPALLQVDTPTVVTDMEGNATASLTPLLPGSCTVTVTDPVTGLTASAQVNIVLTELPAPSPATAVLSDGTALEAEMAIPSGATVILSTDQSGCEIRYTLDGSCPCRAGALIYTEPLTINQDTLLKVAVLRNGVFSTVSSYDLKLEQGHVHSYTTRVTDPTCTEVGYTIYTCSCGDSFTADEVPALGHAFADGSCTRCGVQDPGTAPENPFTDVPQTQWYFQPVLWAVNRGITAGTSATTFSPDQPCTRAQVVTFLWRAFGNPEPVSEDNPFVDVNPGVYYYDAVLWAVENGITAGTSENTFSPNNPCSRSQVVTFLWRAMNKPAPASDNNPFTDVPAAEWYYSPVLWAVENGITAGVSASSFAPSNTCTRSQVVTFLYRAMNMA